MKRSVLAVALATLAAVPAPALGDRPTRTPPTPIGQVTLTGLCDFPLLLEDVVNRAKTLEFSDGRVLSTGALKLRLTNTETGESFVANVSGPTRSTTGGSSTTFFGRALIGLSAEETGGEPILLITSGQVTLTDNADGTVTVSRLRGRATDVCEVLAP